MVEAMDTPNAINTFAILAQEGRAVAAALLPVAPPPAAAAAAAAD